MNRPHRFLSFAARLRGKLPALLALLLLSTTNRNLEAVIIGLETGDQLVNTTTAGQAGLPRIAMRPDGTGFVVVWQNADGGGGSGTDYGVYARLYNANWQPVGNDFLVNTTTAGQQYEPAVAMDPSGNFTVVWTARTQAGGSGRDVVMRRFNAAGTALTGETFVNTTTASDQQLPSIAMNASGNYVVTWASGPFLSEDVKARTFNAAGTATSGEIAVNVTTTDEQSTNDVAIDASGNFIVTWSSFNQDNVGANDYGLYARRFSAAGVATTGETAVNTTTLGNQNKSRIAMDAAGGTATIVWGSPNVAGGSGADVVQRRFNATTLAALTGETFVNTTLASDQFDPEIDLTSAGNYVIVWGGPATGDINARQYNASGTATSGEIAVNLTTAGNQFSPAVGIDSAGDFAVAFGGTPAAGEDIYLRRFAEDPDVSFAAGSSSGAESANASINISRTGIAYVLANVATTVPVTRTGGTATPPGAGQDFTTSFPTNVTFPADGSTLKSLTIAIVNDAVYEPDETIALQFGTVTNGTATGQTTHTYTILDNDAVPPTITNGPPPTRGVIGTAYNFTYTFTGAPAPTFSVTAGALPNGLTLSSAGAISGSPTVGGSFTGTVTATNPVGTATQNFTIVVNQPPVVTNVGPLTLNEDTTLTFAAGNFTPSYSDPNGDPIASVIVTSLPANGVLKNSGSTLISTPVVIAIANIGNLTYVPNGNYNGADSFTWNASDGTQTAVSVATVNLTINTVNDVPSFMKGADQTVLEDAATQSVAGWATALSVGPANEAGQVLNFIVGNNNPALFALQPAIAANGTLTYTPAANANGSATVTVQIHDNGGTANGGVDTSVAQSFTITVTAVNDPPVITAQVPLALAQGHSRTIVFTDLTITDPDNSYPTGFTLTVQNGANYTRVGNTITPAPGFVGTLSVPLQVNDGTANSNVFNLVVTVNPNAEQVATNATIAPEPGGGFRMSFLGAPGATYTIQFTNSLAPANWQTLGTVAAAANGRYSLVDIPPANTPMRFYRSTEPYLNDFGNGLGPVTLRGSAVLTNSAMKLTDEVTGGSGAVVFEGLVPGPTLNGFTARFNLAIGPIVSGVPADGVSFAVGNLGIGTWGELGPGTPNSLAIGFDTFNNGPADGNIGIHVWVNGIHLTASATDPYTNGVIVPVEIRYDAVNGLTVRFNSALIFTNLPIAGFAFPATDGRFGISARTGGFTERATVDDVEITPR